MLDADAIGQRQPGLGSLSLGRRRPPAARRFGDLETVGGAPAEQDLKFRVYEQALYGADDVSLASSKNDHLLSKGRHRALQGGYTGPEMV